MSHRSDTRSVCSYARGSWHLKCLLTGRFMLHSAPISFMPRDLRQDVLETAQDFRHARTCLTSPATLHVDTLGGTCGSSVCTDTSLSAFGSSLKEKSSAQHSVPSVPPHSVPFRIAFSCRLLFSVLCIHWCRNRDITFIVTFILTW